MLVLMGSRISFIVSFVMLYCLCSSTAIQTVDNYNRRSLDEFFQEYAQNSIPRRKTGVLYNVSLPLNYTGMEVSIVRLRSSSFQARGANYRGFRIPPRILPDPFFTRLDIVFSSLGNWSSYYYNVPNYTLVAPVVGFNTYGSRNSTGQIGNLTTPVTKLNLTLFGDPILVEFPKLSLPQDEKAKCVMFYSNGTVEMTNVVQQDTCMVRDQGHLSMVVWAPPPRQGRKGRRKLWQWWVIGFGIGIIGLLSFGFISFIIMRYLRLRKIGQMEKEADKNEGLETTNVGQSRMPSASVVRTQPVLENDYLP